MTFATLNLLSADDLTAMADGTLENTITDMDFLETLASRHCLMVPPWVLQASPHGTLRKVTPLVYTVDGELDKPRILLNLARELDARRVQEGRERFTKRFEI
jgi:hypothetical protein